MEASGKAEKVQGLDEQLAFPFAEGSKVMPVKTVPSTASKAVSRTSPVVAPSDTLVDTVRPP